MRRGAAPQYLRDWRAAALVMMLAALVVLAIDLGPAAGADRPATRPVLVVGNNWEGTVDIVDPHAFKRLARINVVPDLDQRLAEIYADPAKLVLFLAIRQQIGEGHDQLVDDSFTSHDGRFLYVSRPSLADVVSIDLATGRIVWRTHVDGQRADHMAISPDGTRLAVSASLANVVDVLDTAGGGIVARVPSGDSPHENNFSRDGRLLFHASIGRIYTPLEDPPFGAVKGQRVFEVIDTRTWKVLKRVDIGERLAAAGYPGYSSAVRPMAILPDEQHFFFQLSFFHGFVEYDLARDRIERVVRLPTSAHDRNTPKSQYVLNSAHHGIALNGQATKLCVAGTMDNYIAVVSTQTFAYRVIDTGDRPYWATPSSDGRLCFVSLAGDNSIAVVDYATERQIATIPVGRHPQRTRMGRIVTSIVGEAPPRPLPVTPAAAGRARVSVRDRRLALTSSERVTDLQVELRRQGLQAAAGRLDVLDGSGSLTLRPTGRRLRRGIYQARVSGRDAEGDPQETSFTIRVTR